MTVKQRVIALSAVSAVGLAGLGVAAGVALADSGSASTPTAKPSAAPSSSASAPVKSHGKAHGKGGHRMKDGMPGAKNLLHGEFVTGSPTGTAGGYRTIDTQRGTVAAVSATSITLRSADGFTATYAVTSAAQVRIDGEAATVSAVKVGGPAMVVAEKAGGKLTVKTIVVGTAKGHAPAKSGSAAGSPTPAN